MWCKGCGYALDGLEEERCPECGRGFDPSDARTYRASPPKTPLEAGCLVAFFVFFAAIVVGLPVTLMILSCQGSTVAPRIAGTLYALLLLTVTIFGMGLLVMRFRNPSGYGKEIKKFGGPVIVIIFLIIAIWRLWAYWVR
jgi:hypothetical protein